MSRKECNECHDPNVDASMRYPDDHPKQAEGYICGGCLDDILDQ